MASDRGGGEVASALVVLGLEEAATAAGVVERLALSAGGGRVGNPTIANNCGKLERKHLHVVLVEWHMSHLLALADWHLP